MRAEHRILAKKHNVNEVYYVSSNTIIDDDGKIISVQMVKDVETLFIQAKGKVLNIYEGRMNHPGKNQKDYMGIGGFITTE